MKERSGMPYDVVAFDTDECAKLFTLEEEGAFHRLLRHAWTNGSIPDDLPHLSKICRCRSVDQMRKLWAALEPMWPVDPLNISRRINYKQETEREFKQEKSGKAKVSAAKRWEVERKAKALAASNANALRTQSEGNAPLPIPPLPSPPSAPSELKEIHTPAFGVDVFEKLWAEYPNRDGRKQALKHFRASVKTVEDLERCSSALDSYKAHLALHPLKPVKNGSTWFNNWRDWYGWVEPQNGNGKHRAADFSAPPTVPHAAHTCNFCAQESHAWPCTDEFCTMGPEIACPEWRANHGARIGVRR